MDGAKVEKTWQVAEAGAQRKKAWSTQRHRAQAEQAALEFPKPGAQRASEPWVLKEASGQTANARTPKRNAALGRAEQEPPGNKTSVIHPSEGQEPQEGTSPDQLR